MSSRESEVSMPKLSGSDGRRRRWIRIATVASSMAAWIRSGDFGLTMICSPLRAPNIFWNSPSGMIANSSCDWPKTEPFFTHPHDPEVLAANGDDLVDRIGRPEQPVRGLPSEHG